MSKRILVVEDQEDNRQIIRDMLSATDYEIMEAESGEAALASVAKQRPIGRVCERRLPGNGRSSIAWWRARRPCGPWPVAVLTAP